MTDEAVLPGPTTPPTAADGFRRVLPRAARWTTSLLVLAGGVIPIGAFALRRADTALVGEDLAFLIQRRGPALAVLAAATTWLLAALVVSRLRLWWRPFTLAPLLGLLFATCAGTGLVDAEAHLGPACTGPYGGSYRVLVSEGRFLVRVTSVSDWDVHVVAVAVAPSHGALPAVIRPAGAADDSGLRIAPDGTVLDLDAHGRCRQCFRARPSVVHSRRDWRAAAEEALGYLSPFVLLGEDEQGEEADLQRLLARLAAPDAGAVTPPICAPPEHALLNALDSPNAWVRDAARRLISAGGPGTYPEATKRL